MCGNFSILRSAEEIEKRFKAKIDSSLFKQEIKTAPSQNLPVVTNTEPGIVNFYRWGLIPSWSKDIKFGNILFNARAETILEKQSFRNSFKSKRCLVIADGFYEWVDQEGHKKPYKFSLHNHELFAFAGLWDKWSDISGNIIYSFTIITTEPNEIVSKYHDRMPVILRKETEALWLDNSAEERNIIKLLKPYNSEQIIVEEFKF
ncbi:MAG: SOS response-associated peptidase [Bacteroidota bacterium]|nr:SOS response-associated peptidase [Bacteroidota bacterium]